MAIKLNSERQDISFAHVDVSFADLASGVATAAVKLPVGSIVLSGALNVNTAFNAGTSATIKVGDASLLNRYLGATSVQAAGRTALAPTGFVTTADQPAVSVELVVVGAAPTAGQFRLEVAYATKGVARFVQE